MPTYDVTIRMVIHKTYRVEAGDEEGAAVEARSICFPDDEDVPDDYYTEETIEAKLVPAEEEEGQP